MNDETDPLDKLSGKIGESLACPKTSHTDLYGSNGDRTKEVGRHMQGVLVGRT